MNMILQSEVDLLAEEPCLIVYSFRYVQGIQKSVLRFGWSCRLAWG
jgi:hypothetical protein